jgi:hypothetical protein
VLQFDASYNTHSHLYKEWNALAKDWERVRNEKDDISANELAVRVRELDTKELTIENEEPALGYFLGNWTLESSQRAVDTSLGIAQK